VAFEDVTFGFAQSLLENPKDDYSLLHGKERAFTRYAKDNDFGY